jgi:hypothetical protein
MKWKNAGRLLNNRGNYVNNKTMLENAFKPEKNSNIDFNRFNIHKVKPGFQAAISL